MKCKLLVPVTKRNPEYKIKEAHRLRAMMIPYKVPRKVVMPEGTIIEHPMAHFHCIAGIAEPADDECAKVMENYSSEYLSRQKLIFEQLRQARRIGAATGVTKYDADHKRSPLLLPVNTGGNQKTVKKAIRSS